MHAIFLDGLKPQISGFPNISPYIYIRIYVYIYIVKPAHFHHCITACTCPVGSSENQFPRQKFSEGTGLREAFLAAWRVGALIAIGGGYIGCVQPFLASQAVVSLAL
jgi:hypothetical protein